MTCYLDYNATAPIRLEAAEAMWETLAEPHNASSIHSYGRNARRSIEHAREKVADLVNTNTHNVIFTSSGTEANNWVFQGIDATTHIISAIEHPSVLKAATNPITLPVTRDGVIDLVAAESILKEYGHGALVSVMLANNETGVIQPIKELAELAHSHGAVIHTDAVQAAGKIPVDITNLNVDVTSISSHKLGGPQGAAALIINNCLTIAPMLKGGGQELGRRAGTENVAAIVGFGVAAEIAAKELPNMQRLATFRDTIERNILTCTSESMVFGKLVSRLPNTTCITMPGVSNETQLMAFDLSGIAVSAGSACTSGKVEASHVLTAMGATEEGSSTAIRISTGWQTTKQDIETLVETWQTLYDRCGTRSQQQAA